MNLKQNLIKTKHFFIRIQIHPEGSGAGQDSSGLYTAINKIYCAQLSREVRVIYLQQS